MINSIQFLLESDQSKKLFYFQSSVKILQKTHPLLAILGELGRVLIDLFDFGVYFLLVYKRFGYSTLKFDS